MWCTIMLRKKFFILLFFPLFIFAVGSDTAPSRESLIRFPTGGDDTVYGFAALDGGFILADAATSFTFNSFMPVNGAGAFNGGSCILQEDMNCSSQFQIVSSGSFTGNGHSLKFFPRDNTVNFPLQGTFTQLDQQNTGAIIYCLSWTNDEQYIAVGNTGWAGQELQVYGFNGTTIAATPTSTYEIGTYINDLRFMPGSSSYFVAAIGAAPGLRSYLFNGSPTLTQINTAGATMNACAFRPSGDFVAGGRTTSGAGVEVYSYSAAGALGATATASVAVSGTINYLAMDWHPSEDYIAVGADASPYLNILYFNGTTLTSALTLNVGYSVTSVGWSSDGTLLAAGIVDTSGTPQRLRIYQFDQSPLALTEITSYRIGAASSIHQLNWNSDDTYLAVGYAAGGYEVQVYYNDDNAQKLFLIGEYPVGSEVWGCKWSSSDTYLASGDVASDLSVYEFVDNSAGLVFDTTDVVLNSPVVFGESVHFQGVCSANFNGHSLDLNGQTLYVDAGASLALQNVTLKNITGSNILCADSAGTLSCNNVTFELSGNFDFSQGALSIIGDTRMTGEYSFTYSSDQNCTISSGATWFFDSGMTLRYDPAGGANNLFVFEDALAQLQLYETILYAPSTGLRLTKGTIIVDGECPVISDATNENGGIWIGDGVSSVNNATLSILSESGFVLQSGYLVYKNV